MLSALSATADMQAAPVIFLDIDGVLNRAHSWVRYATRKHCTQRGHIDRECLAVLNGIVRDTKAEIVLSSSWRLFQGGNRRCVRLLRKMGVRGRVIGCTPYLCDKERGDEIASWLRIHRMRRYVILDDDRDMRHLSGRLVKTKFQSGLLPVHAWQARRLLA